MTQQWGWNWKQLLLVMTTKFMKNFKRKFKLGKCYNLIDMHLEFAKKETTVSRSRPVTFFHWHEDDFSGEIKVSLLCFDILLDVFSRLKTKNFQFAAKQRKCFNLNWNIYRKLRKLILTWSVRKQKLHLHKKKLSRCVVMGCEVEWGWDSVVQSGAIISKNK